jgi:organic hydroperoxide reductase OsmC/OhrA
MPEHLQDVLSTAMAVVEGGREDHGRSLDGRLDADLSAPESMGGSGGPGTNPEELFAVGYAACFQSPLLSVATGRRRDASGSRITRGDIDVELSVNGVLLPTGAKLACGIIRSDGST